MDANGREWGRTRWSGPILSTAPPRLPDFQGAGDRHKH
jgi:hypothetical protein